MYYSLRGKLIFSDASTAAVECGGVGYLCNITFNTRQDLPEIGRDVFLLTHLNVREDALVLFGFSKQAELDCFRLITTVNGLGAKLGMIILSEFTPEQLLLALAAGDSKSLTRAPGVGPKLAQRMVLELKDKVGGLAAADNADIISAGAASASGSAAEAVAALAALGYSQSEASLAVGRLDSSLPVESLIREALKSMARQK